jgi:tetratricopeptide (TPR) repeat protein
VVSEFSSETAESPQSAGFLGGLATHGTARYERAIEACQKAIKEEPDSYPGYGGLASSYFFLDRFPEAEKIMQRAAERKVEIPTFQVMHYIIGVLKGDKDQMDRAVALAKGRHAAEHWVGPRGGSCSGSFRPVAGCAEGIKPGRGSRRCKRGTTRW